MRTAQCRSDHPSFYEPEWGRLDMSVYENDVQAVVEERAERDIETCAQTFVDWITNTLDGAELAAFVAKALEENERGSRCDDIRDAFRAACAQLRKDYSDHRTELARRDGEWDDIENSLAEEA